MTFSGHNKKEIYVSYIVRDIQNLLGSYDLDDIILEVLDGLVPGQKGRMLPMDQAMEYGHMLRAIRSGIDPRLENRSWWGGRFSKP